ncbi:uncharacterized protein L203_100603 [Cryptococcus depauperatus CBS 7841]|uniref:Uncharacterized protein n=1 Tax=Cryptococcus depauperatus CBS 7841 TaxID=1295531 RepID=A0AAJ8LZ76_9TREE
MYNICRPQHIYISVARQPQRLLTTSLWASSQQDERPKIQTWFLKQPLAQPSESEACNAPTDMIPAPSPLPLGLPPALQKFHAFLTEPSPSQASEVILPHTLSFFNTRSASASPEAAHFLHDFEFSAKGDRMIGNLLEEGEVIKGEDAVSPAWEWVGVVQVRGRGRGIVNRADGVIRRWLLKNPLSPELKPVTLEHPKTPRIDPDADWSIVPREVASGGSLERQRVDEGYGTLERNLIIRVIVDMRLGVVLGQSQN